MHYAETRPAPALERYVECYWSLEAEAGEASRETVMPDGCVEVVANFGRPFLRCDGGSKEEQRELIAAGQIRCALELEPTGRVELFGIRFQPAGAGMFLDVPMAELSGAIPALEDLAPSLARSLGATLGERFGLSARARAADALLLARLQEPRALMALAEAATTRLVAAHGRRTIDRLADDLGVGTRRLERSFRRYVGLTPKQLSGILRFQRVFQLLEARVPPALSELALDCGYYDQAHFAREFRRFAGRNATSALAQVPGWAQYLTRAQRGVGFLQDGGAR